MSKLQELFQMIEPVPDDWGTGRAPKDQTQEVVSDAVECSSYAQLLEQWQKAMTWNTCLDTALSTVLAVSAGTTLQGDQVWLRLLGVAGTAKSTICEALAKNKDYTFPMSMLTGLHSGYTGSGAGDDASIIPRLNRKTMIINEGDMILKAPNREQIMAELRDLYTGIARCHYRNGKEAVYSGLRISVIIAGTPSLRALNKSALGDRFLDCVVYEKESEESERQLVKSVLDNTFLESLTESTDEAATQENPDKILAQQMTAGYVNWLRQNLGSTLSCKNWQEKHIKSPKKLTEDCEALGLLVACMRTRAGLGDEEQTEKELHIRLSKQFRKLAVCDAYAMNTGVNKDVMRRVTKVATDTCYGHTYQVCRTLQTAGKQDVRNLAVRLGIPDDRVKKALGVLMKLDCVRADTISAASGALGRARHVFRLAPAIKNILDRTDRVLQERN